MSGWKRQWVYVCLGLTVCHSITFVFVASFEWCCISLYIRLFAHTNSCLIRPALCRSFVSIHEHCIEDHQVECIKRFDVTVTSSAVLRCTTFIYCLLYCGIFLLAAIGHVRFVRLLARLLVVSTPGVYWVVGGSVVFRTFFGAFVCTYLRIVPLFYCYYS